MGAGKAEFKCPRGVTIREYESGRAIYIAFSYQGVECREALAVPVTAGAIKYAASLRDEIRRKVRDGTFVYTDYFPNSKRAGKFGPSPARVTLGDLLRAQLRTYQQACANGNISPSTLDGYRKAIEGKLLRQWNEVLLKDATPAKLREWIGGLGITSKAARNILTPLRSVFEDALNDEKIQFNPFDRIALKKLLKQTAKPSDYEVDPFDSAERSALISAARADEAPLVAFWFETGLRPGELIALEWPKIDWIHGRARIDLNRVMKTDKGPKTAAGVRDIDLTAEAIQALKDQKAATFLAGKRVFHNPRSGEPWDTDAQVRKTLWDPLCKRAGVRYRNPYQARHTFASARLTAGANPWWLAQQMGHEDVEMVFKIYGKWIDERFRKEAAFRTPVARADPKPADDAASA